MSDVISHPEPASTETPILGQVMLAELDDKHLGQYRHPNERWALAAIFVGMALVLIGLWLARPYLGNILNFLPSPILHILGTWLDPTRLGLVVLGLLVLTAVMDIVGQSTRAWQLVAQAVEVTPTTFPQLAPIVDDLRTRFDLPDARVYVSRDAPVTGYTIGVRPPFAIVFSSVGVGQLTPDEFSFALGSEMGSIKLGHTVMAMLLGNARMSLPQPFQFLLKFRAVIFGSYHHAQTLSCDRIGVVATRNVKPAIETLIKQNLGQVRGAKIDIKSLTPQTAAMQQGFKGRVLRTTMVLNGQPFAVARLAELVAWAGEPVVPVPTAPAAPSPPSPAASARAAAASAKEAAASAAAAATAAALPAAAAALLTPASDGADAAEPAVAGTAAEPAPAMEAVAAPAPTPEAIGAGAAGTAPEGGTVSVAAPPAPREEGREPGDRP